MDYETLNSYQGFIYCGLSSTDSITGVLETPGVGAHFVFSLSTTALDTIPLARPWSQLSRSTRIRLYQRRSRIALGDILLLWTLVALSTNGRAHRLLLSGLLETGVPASPRSSNLFERNCWGPPRRRQYLNLILGCLLDSKIWWLASFNS